MSDINRSGSFCLVQACLPFLHQAKGSGIVNIASGAGLLPNGKGWRPMRSRTAE